MWNRHFMYGVFAGAVWAIGGMLLAAGTIGLGVIIVVLGFVIAEYAFFVHNISLDATERPNSITAEDIINILSKGDDEEVKAPNWSEISQPERERDLLLDLLQHAVWMVRSAGGERVAGMTDEEIYNEIVNSAGYEVDPWARGLSALDEDEY